MAEGQKITREGGRLRVPDHPIIPFMEGDGVGPDIWAASVRVFDAAVGKAYGGRRSIVWKEVLAGEKAMAKTGTPLPEESLAIVRDHRVAIKGPLTTPVGGGIRSLNVAIRQKLDLYACIRPIRYFRGVGSPLKTPEKVDFVIFRENTEDVYAGIEWASGSKEAKELIETLQARFDVKIRPDSAIGLKPVSPFASKRLVARAIRYALESERDSVTLVHKGNIMKFTEGAFKEWGYEVAKEQFGEQTITETEVTEQHDGTRPVGKLLVRDRIADAMFQQIMLRPEEYSVIATLNLNGDYLSDAAAALVGGLGLAPGANVGDDVAFFEATHGTAPKYAGQDRVNPGSLILSGVMMLEHIGWREAAASIVAGLETAIRLKTVTYDLARQIEGAKVLKCSEFGSAIIANL